MKLPDSVIGVICNRYRSGCDLATIADMMGIPQAEVTRILRIKNLYKRATRRDRPPALSDADIKTMIVEYRSGARMSQLAKLYRVSQATVRSALVKAGAHSPSGHGQKKPFPVPVQPLLPGLGIPEKIACANCKWFLRILGNTTGGDCTRHAPGVTGFPWVKVTMVCGDHERS